MAHGYNIDLLDECIRKLGGVTKVAAKGGYSEPFIARIKNGTYPHQLRPRTMKDLARMFKHPEDALFPPDITEPDFTS